MKKINDKILNIIQNLMLITMEECGELIENHINLNSNYGNLRHQKYTIDKLTEDQVMFCV